MILRRLAAPTLTATIIAAAGCGGSSSGPSTRAEFIKKADAICRRINAQISSNPIHAPQDYARVAPQLAAYEQPAIAELGKLVPPASIASDWRQIVADARRTTEDTAKLGEYAKANRLKQAFAALAADGSVQQQRLALAKRDGFKDCAEPG